MQAVLQFKYSILISVYRKFLLGIAELQVKTEASGSYKDWISPT